MKKIIPYGRQHIDKSDIQEVAIALSKDKLTTGELTLKFEKKIGEFLNCKYSITCNSGTSALFIALNVLNLKKGDKIIMPSINFISSYSVAKFLGAKVYLADVDRFTGQMRPEDVENCCKKFGIKNFDILVVMYNGGYPQNAEKFKQLKNKYKCYIVEDACHALGSSYRYKKKYYKVGSCKHSDICTFSLHPLKTITTGEGGIVTTNNKILFDKMKMIRSLGIKRSNKKHWEYDVLLKGLNLRLTDFQSALGLSQLKKINKFIQKRKKISLKYNEEIKKIKQISLPKFKNNYKSSHHLYIIHLQKQNMNLKEKMIKFMLKNRVMLQYHYIPIYKFKIFQDKYINKNAEIYYNNAISLPIYYSLHETDQNLIIRLLKKFFKLELS
jgi:dTDP-4-amino-4,6-dideoxygalactose transaminase